MPRILTPGQLKANSLTDVDRYAGPELPNSTLPRSAADATDLNLRGTVVRLLAWQHAQLVESYSRRSHTFAYNSFVEIYEMLSNIDAKVEVTKRTTQGHLATLKGQIGEIDKKIDDIDTKVDTVIALEDRHFRYYDKIEDKQNLTIQAVGDIQEVVEKAVTPLPLTGTARPVSRLPLDPQTFRKRFTAMRKNECYQTGFYILLGILLALTTGVLFKPAAAAGCTDWYAHFGRTQTPAWYDPGPTASSGTKGFDFPAWKTHFKHLVEKPGRSLYSLETFKPDPSMRLIELNCILPNLTMDFGFNLYHYDYANISHTDWWDAPSRKEWFNGSWIYETIDEQRRWQELERVCFPAIESVPLNKLFHWTVSNIYRERVQVGYSVVDREATMVEEYKSMVGRLFTEHSLSVPFSEMGEVEKWTLLVTHGKRMLRMWRHALYYLRRVQFELQGQKCLSEDETDTADAKAWYDRNPVLRRLPLRRPTSIPIPITPLEQGQTMQRLTTKSTMSERLPELTREGHFPRYAEDLAADGFGTPYMWPDGYEEKRKKEREDVFRNLFGGSKYEWGDEEPTAGLSIKSADPDPEEEESHPPFVWGENPSAGQAIKGSDDRHAKWLITKARWDAEAAAAAALTSTTVSPLASTSPPTLSVTPPSAAPPPWAEALESTMGGMGFTLIEDSILSDSNCLQLQPLCSDILEDVTVAGPPGTGGTSPAPSSPSSASSSSTTSPPSASPAPTSQREKRAIPSAPDTGHKGTARAAASVTVAIPNKLKEGLELVDELKAQLGEVQTLKRYLEKSAEMAKGHARGDLSYDQGERIDPADLSSVLASSAVLRQEVITGYHQQLQGRVRDRMDWSSASSRSRGNSSMTGKIKEGSDDLFYDYEDFSPRHEVEVRFVTGSDRPGAEDGSRFKEELSLVLDREGRQFRAYDCSSPINLRSVQDAPSPACDKRGRSH